MAAPNRYRDGPDGLPARLVGPWVTRKNFYVDGYRHIVATGMKNAWPRRAYVELFAGPGVSIVRGTNEATLGSPLQALVQDFTDYVFVDLDPIAVDALRARIAAAGIPAGKTVTVLGPIDCNDAVDQIRALIPASALMLAFVDPTGWQFRFDRLSALVAGRSVDLMVTFHSPQMRRVGKLPSSDLDAFFATTAWRDCLSQVRWEVLSCLADLYGRQLAGIGYQPAAGNSRVPVYNRRGRPIYELAMFSKHPKGTELWGRNVDRRDPNQLTLW